MDCHFNIAKPTNRMVAFAQFYNMEIAVKIVLVQFQRALSPCYQIQFFIKSLCVV